MSVRHRFWMYLFLAMGLTVPFTVTAASLNDDAAACLGCHASADMSLSFEDGTTMNVQVDQAAYAQSVHGSQPCGACHKGFTVDSHPNRSFKNKAALTKSWATACLQCHNFLKGIHKSMVDGQKGATCSDCHGSHAITAARKDGECMGCHGRPIPVTFAGGDTKTILVPPNALAGSVHEALRCDDCHFGFSAKEHPVRQFESARHLTIGNADACRRCHFDKYTRSLESIHYKQLSQGNLMAPVCVDCHGSHGVQKGRADKIASAARCKQCHGSVYETYASSVHGRVLLSARQPVPGQAPVGEHFPHGNAMVFKSGYTEDVPVCADCHLAHNTGDPHSTDYRNRTPEMCGNCHANEELMTRHGLTTNVLQSYLDDFHGITLSLYKKQGFSVRRIAVCTDCHGVHDISRTKGPASTMVKEKLLERCRKCHPDAKTNFPDSWISHYQPSMKQASLVWAVNLIYDIFIPFMLAGLVLQILLHIWRYAVNR